MGVRPVPGSIGRPRGGQQQPARTGLDAIEEYGRGEKDPETGLYDWYDLPAGVAQPETQHGGVSVLDLCEEWDLLVADFASEYGIRVRTADLSWREFTAYLTGLMSCDSRLARRFTPTDDDTNEAGGDDGGW